MSSFADVKKYFGIVKCVVKAPDSVLFPVLPSTFNGKLVFSLCSMCAREKMQQYCEHEGAERHLESTWCTPELHDALDNGYEIVKIHEVWHWDRRREGFFAEYIDTFLKIKMEASGWPTWCVT